MDLCLPAVVALNGWITPSLSLFILFGTLRDVILAAHVPSVAPCSGVWLLHVSFSETPPLPRPPSSPLRLRWGSQSRGVPRESFDASTAYGMNARSSGSGGTIGTSNSGPGSVMIVPSDAKNTAICS